MQRLFTRARSASIAPLSHNKSSSRGSSSTSIRNTISRLPLQLLSVIVVTTVVLLLLLSLLNVLDFSRLRFYSRSDNEFLLRTPSAASIAAAEASSPRTDYTSRVMIDALAPAASCWDSELHSAWQNSEYTPSSCDAHINTSFQHVTVNVITVAFHHRDRGDVWMCAAGKDIPAGRLFFHTNSYSNTALLPIGTVRESDDSKHESEYRYIHAIEWAVAHAVAHPQIQWITIIDDDALLFPRQLLHTLDRYNSSEPLFIGQFYQYEHGIAAVRLMGGGGFVLSRAAALQLRPIIRDCLFYGNIEWSDVFLTHCIRDLLPAVALINDHGFHGHSLSSYYEMNSVRHTFMDYEKPLGRSTIVTSHYNGPWQAYLYLYRLYAGFSWCVTDKYKPYAHSEKTA